MSARGAMPDARSYGDLVRQYLELRDAHPGVVLLFRVGSFYEVLFEDAEVVARELGLKLGDRPSGGSAAAVPQCGFAHHALDNFLPRLLGRGYRVAVCDESEEEQEGIRRRSVVRTLTPGTVTDPRLLREDKPTYLVAIAPAEDAGRVGLAWTDLAAGEFRIGEFAPEEAAAELQRLDPSEVLVADDRPAPERLIRRRAVNTAGELTGAAQLLEWAYPDLEVDGTIAELPLGTAAGGLIVRYLERTQGQDHTRPDTPLRAAAGDSLRLDAATQRHLEIVETERGRDRTGSLLAAVDRAVTPMGRRMLRSWLLRPLTSTDKIALRQRIIAELLADRALRDSLGAQLAAMSDLERISLRAREYRATIDDMRALAAASAAVGALAALVASARTPFLFALGKRRQGLLDFAARAAEVLVADGQEVRPDANDALRTAYQAVEAAASWQARYLAEVRRLPGLSKARLERTTTQGLFVELPVNTPVPVGWSRRGGLQKVERYSTPELEAHAVELAEAEALVAHHRRIVVDNLRAAAAVVAPEVRDLARNLAAADALLSLARVAEERRWVRPTVDGGGEIAIVGGRHPVLESDEGFQPNDARLVATGEQDQLVLLTGPNMAGKSTWMRQIALIVLLAQAGSYVPAAQARIGLVDAIFTRIGAVDDLAGGRSTFMVEMAETAAVLAGATERSLVLLDEIGRGTSTHDGMAIAWAVIEHLAAGPVRPRTVVATHYHELAALQRGYAQVALLRAAVEERPDGVTFTHRIEPGAADRSFGIEVARLAGLPPEVLARARAVADAVEPLTAEIAANLVRAHRPAPLRQAS